jgi:serine/threonine protein kinase/Tol biopolymer transport system component
MARGGIGVRLPGLNAWGGDGRRSVPEFAVHRDIMPELMPLAPGSRLSHYEVIAPLGAGGMGEVYRARDTRLSREVAIKILAQHLSSNPDLKARFAREANAISALQHPNICVLHDIGSEDGLDFLVMELVDGETLADRIERKPLSRNEALKIAIEVADALDKAHRSGIIHRDLKPANVMLTKSGAKLMDFGLAKSTSFVNGSHPSAPAFSGVATATSPAYPLTAVGTVVGTVQYMSPEQIQGKEADGRSDVFAFGALLYEMLTGKRAFDGKSQLSVASAILEKEPEAISTIQPLTPASLEHIVMRALEKDPDSRWQSMSDVRAELEWVATSVKERSVPSSHPSRNWLYAAVALLALLSLLYVANRFQSTATAPLLKVSVLPPADGSFAFYGDNGSEPILSPDGKHIAFAAIVGGKQLLYVRALDEETPRPLASTEGGRFPFWSPDGKQLAYFAGTRLMKLDLSSGVSSEIAKVDNPRGGTWNSKGEILFTPNFRSPIFAVSANGGEPRPVTQIDFTQFTSHRWPFFLPDGEHFIYLAANHRLPSDSKNALYVTSLKGGTPKRVISSIANGVVAGSYLFFSRDNGLYAQEFDLKRLELKGEAKIIAPYVMRDMSTWRAMFSASDSGLVTFASGADVPISELAWYDRSGKRLGRVGEPSDYYVLSASHDGKKIAVEVMNNGVWIADARANTMSRLTFNGTSARQPVISPDGSQVAFQSDLSGRAAVLRRFSNGFGGQDTLIDGSEAAPNDWSSDGRYLLVQSGDNGTYSLQALEMFGAKRLIPLVRIPGQQAYDGAFSPDLKWFLYTSTDNGREEVFVSPLNLNTESKDATVAPAARWMISNGGGIGRWSHDGREIYYYSSDGKMMSVAVRASATSFEYGAPKELFPVRMKIITGMPYDVTPDGRFLVNTALQPPSSPVTLITDWRRLVK